MEEIELALTNPNELTRSSSPASSLTTENSDHKSNGEQCGCAAQADERHNQYLNRLEASFVKQLHQSTSWLARLPNRSVNRNVPVNQPNEKASKQFTVLHNGCREKTNFGRAITTDSRDIFRSPWVKHFKHGDQCSSGLRLPDVSLSECKQKRHEKNLLQDQGTSAHEIIRNSVDMLIDETCLSKSDERKRMSSVLNEGFGQNFVNEDCDHYATFRVKKLKLSVADSSSADQIVPSSDVDVKIHPVIGQVTAQDQPRIESLLDEYRENAVTEQVLQSFLRGR